MATRAEQSARRWKEEICDLTSSLNHLALYQAARASVSQEVAESIKRQIVALVERLEQGDDSLEPRLLPALASLSCKDSTPPSSPISLSPSSSPRVTLRDIKDHVPLRDMKDATSTVEDSAHPVYLPPIHTHPPLTQPLPIVYPLSSHSTFRQPTQGFGGIPARNDHAPDPSDFYPHPPTTTSAFSQPSARVYARPYVSFVDHSFDKANSHSPTPLPIPQPNYPNPNQHVPRRTIPGSAAIVITQPIATICEVPGFKRRGRPSTRIDNQCVECGTHKTPEWRRGEGGVHLCNACGLQYSKRVRREKAEKKRNAITAVLNLDV